MVRFPEFCLYLPMTEYFMCWCTTGYIGEFELIDDHRSGKIVVQLNGRLNKTGVISPRFNVQVTQIESWVNLLLPSRGFGIIILVSTFSRNFRILWVLTMIFSLFFLPFV